MTAFMLATADQEFGLVPAAAAQDEAQRLADQHGEVVTIRHPVTDKVKRTVKPAKLSMDKNAKRRPARGRKAAARPATAPKATKAARGAPRRAKKAPAKAAHAPTLKGPANGAHAHHLKLAKAPKGMVVRILELASRPEGVSPAELNELTTWKGAPWKWLFANPKGTGYCDRWGYSLTLLPGETPRGVRYHVEKTA